MAYWQGDLACRRLVRSTRGGYTPFLTYTDLGEQPGFTCRYGKV